MKQTTSAKIRLMATTTTYTNEDSFNSTGSHEYHSGNSGNLELDTSPLQGFIKCGDGELCFGCGSFITERFLLKVNERAWHVACLRCCVCNSPLDRQTTCFVREDHVYCKLDYSKEFGTKCSKCLRTIQPTDWVRRAKDNVYHLACFACDSCKRQLSTGEEFALQDNKVLCKTHYIEIIEGGPSSENESTMKNKTKRVRTTFTEEQIQILQANFQLDSNPDGQDLERIAQITNLSKRVTQVWFQNSRARQKKHQQGQPHPGAQRSPASCGTGRSLSSPNSPTHSDYYIW